MKTLMITAILMASLSLPTAPALAERECSNRIDVSVNGLVCDFCARALEKVFDDKQAVKEIAVNMDKGIVKVHLQPGETLSDEAITGLVTDSGYNVRTINRNCL